jgi:hypothetical protein
VTHGRNNELENDLKESSYGLKDVLFWKKTINISVMTVCILAEN